MIEDISKILQERNKTHGSFIRNAAVSQGIKDIMKAESTYKDLTLVHKECLDMIALKISRILSGKAVHAEHWDDIAGYAKLGSAQIGITK